MNQETHKQALLGERLLRQAVLDEFRYKAKLDQYVIVNRNGKPYKVSAREALRKAEQAAAERNEGKLP